MNPIEATGIPWGDIAGGGAVLAVLVAIVLFLKDRADQRKFDEVQRRESHETIRKAHESVICVSDKFAQAVGENTETFAKTITATLLQADQANERREATSQAAHQKCEDTIHQLLRDAPRAHAREKGEVG